MYGATGRRKEHEFSFLNQIDSGNRRGENSAESGSRFWDQTQLDEIYTKEDVEIQSEIISEDNDVNSEETTVKGGGCCCTVNRIFWWSPPQQSLPVEFCKNTSLHGLKFIGQPKRHLCERIFWIISFTIGIIMAGFLISDSYSRFTNNPIIVSFMPVETLVREIPFPAITICNMNKVRNSKAQEYMSIAREGDSDDEKVKKALKNLYYVNHVCSTSNSFSKKFNYSAFRGKIDDDLLEKIKYLDINSTFDDRNRVQDFFAEGSQTCHNMVPRCVWRGTQRNCSEIIRPVETDFGKCCTFNMVPQTLMHRGLNDSRDDPKTVDDWENSNLDMDDLVLEFNDEYGGTVTRNMSKYPRRVRRAGKSFGLSIFVQPDIAEYFCTTSDSIGFRLAIHLPIEVPHVVDSGIGIPPNSEIFVSLTPDVTSGNSDIRDFPLDVRRCYLKGEYNLQFYKFYTAPNCIDECISNTTFERCKCVRYFMPRDDNRRLCDNPIDFNCTDFVKREFVTAAIKDFCSQCYPTCTEIGYKGVTTVTTLQSLKQTGEDLRDSAYSMMEMNASIVHVYFAEESFYPKIRKQLHDTTDFIANIGGLLGLCLGFSGLSAIEFVYFATLQLWCKFRKNRFQRLEKNNREPIHSSSKIATNLRKRREFGNGRRVEEVKEE